mgnify:FL=1
MKRNFIVILALVLALTVLTLSVGLVACNDNDEPSVDEKPSDQEYTLPFEDGKKQLTIYWTYPGGVDFATSDIWMWWTGKEGSGYTMHECAYGGKVVVNVPDSIEEVGFIVRVDCSDPGGSAWGTATKDFESDRFAVLTDRNTVIYLKSGDGNQYKSSDGGVTLEQIKLFTIANMMSLHSVSYNVTPKVKIDNINDIKLIEGEREIALKSLSSLGQEVVSGVVETEEELDITKSYKLQIKGYGDKVVVPLGVFGSEEFAEKYNYDGELGAVVKGNTTEFKLWAPTASKVVLNLFQSGNGGSAYQTIEMEKADKGVWLKNIENCGHGTYYTYTVTTSLETQEAVDPYARSAGVNGDRGMVVDLSRTNPDGWGSVSYMTTARYTDAVIWEVHVRDFSNKISQSRYKGKFMAFTERGLKNSAGISVGVDYLLDLGVTHVHLMPSYDYATVDEANPDSGFNWGYDPKNYNVPEGSYSTNPYDGEVRVTEFKKMVQSLHEAGLSVVMDVVYNHTYDANSNFNKIVPYYYYRYTSSGANSSASGCGNDTASERYMFRRFMVDSVSYWMKEYKVDGFRFDLMGLHDLETMRQIEQALHQINPSAIIYGEGWSMGSTVDGSKQANQTNIKEISATNGAAGSVALFNDVIRDGLKGSVFNSASKGYINGAGKSNINAVKFGINGASGVGASWSVKNSAVINYMSCHDNLSLWDKLAVANANDTLQTRLAMNRLGATIVMMSSGTPLMQAGEEMLRTKNGDENSFKSSDAINNIDWESLTPNSDQYAMMQYYKGLIALRKSSDLFTASAGVAHMFDVDSSTGFMAVKYDNHRGNYALLILNPTSSAVSYSLDGEWRMYADGSTASAQAISTVSGTIQIPAYSAIVLRK